MEQNELAAEESARLKWSRVIDQQRSSGLPVSVFCRERSLPVSSYYGWRRKLSGGPPDRGFIEARVVGEAAVEGKKAGVGNASAWNSSGVRIDLAGGRQILVTRGFDRLLLLEVIQVLEGVAPMTLAGS
jgi:hypothetical protein